MKKIDDYNIRLEMVDMHNTYINNLETSFNNKNYIETSWICYSIFEQRVNRLIEKNIQYCQKQTNIHKSKMRKIKKEKKNTIIHILINSLEEE